MVFGNRPPARILLEASTQSEWVAQLLEQLGARGDRGRPELCADVCDPVAACEDGPARRAGAEALRLGAFEAFLGLVPGDLSSGEKRRIGRITKRGDVRSRYLLVEAGWRVLRSKRPETAALRAWALTIAPRRAGTVFDRDD